MLLGEVGRVKTERKIPLLKITYAKENDLV